MNRWMMVAGIGAGCLALGVLDSLHAEPESSPTSEDEPAAVPQPFADELLKATSGYEGWWCATENIPHFAPLMCSFPQPGPSVRLSDANASPHGKKLYYLFVRMRQTETIVPPPPERSVGSIRTTYWYGATLPDFQPTGQAFVKQSWTAVEGDYERLMSLSPEAMRRYGSVPGYVIDHKAKTAFRAGEQRELFVMMKMDPATPGTDNGWVYGVLSPDGKQVLHAGRIESCMGCHVESPHDRLFGLK